MHPDHWRRLALYLTCILFVFGSCPGRAEHSPGMNMAAPDAEPFDRSLALSTSSDAVGRLLPDVRFTDADGQEVWISRFKGKPLVISPIYTSCYHICPTTTRNLDKAVKAARAALDTDSFNVLSIGFDTIHDTPPMMREFAREQGVEDPDWYFLSGDQATMKAFTKALGFIYQPSGGGFDHLIQTTIVDADGRIYRQLYGMAFDTPYLVEPLKRLVFRTEDAAGTLDNLVKQVRLFCTVYDPVAGRYRIDYSLYIGTTIGFLCVFTLGFVLVREWRKTMRARRAQS